MSKSYNNIAMHVSTVTIAVNIVLFVFKFIVGLVANSSAMISDSIHSASDVISTVIVIIGIKAAGKSSDKNHPYGHERIECIASILLSVTLFITGAMIGINGIKNVLTKNYIGKPEIKQIAVIAAIISVLVKEWMFRYTMYTAKKINSTSLAADAWHHRSDALSSVGALMGIGLSMAGYAVFDSIASIIICILIIKVSVDIFLESCRKMIDTAADETTQLEIIKTVKTVDGVIEINKLKTRLFASKLYVDIEISANGSLLLTQAHEIAHSVHDLLEKEFPEIKHCMVHVNPHKDEKENK